MRFFCHIAPVVLNEVRKINIVCEGFVISKIHDAYCFILNSIFKICLGRGGKEVYTIFSDEFITKFISELIEMNDNQIFYDHFHLKLNLEKSFLCKWKILHKTIKLNFRAPSDEILEMLFKKAINECNSNTKCVSSLVNLMKRNVNGYRIILITLKENLGYVVLPGLSPTIVP